jgi:hypothetical protein
MRFAPRAPPIAPTNPPILVLANQSRWTQAKWTPRPIGAPTPRAASSALSRRSCGEGKDRTTEIPQASPTTTFPLARPCSRYAIAAGISANG